jgi:hypothetical protein
MTRPVGTATHLLVLGRPDPEGVPLHLAPVVLKGIGHQAVQIRRANIGSLHRPRPSQGIAGQRYYCKFTVVGGARTDIRGTAFVLGFNVNPIVLYQVDAE